jgi:hypothetical protein
MEASYGDERNAGGGGVMKLMRVTVAFSVMDLLMEVTVTMLVRQ